MRGTLGLLALALAACKPDDTGETDTETGDTDTVDTDTGPAPCTDFAFGGDLEVPHDVVVPEGATRIGMFPFAFESMPTFDQTYASVEVAALPAAGSAASFELCIPAVPDEQWFQDVGDTDAPARVAIFMVGAWQDADADAAFDEGEAVVGGTVRFVAYAEGDLPPEIADLGAEEGWNVLHFDLANMDAGPTSVVPFQSGYTGYDLPANLLMADHASVEGLVSPSGPGTVNVSLLHASEMLQVTPADPMLSDVTVDVTDAGAAFALPLVDPPEDHRALAVGDGPAGAEVALYWAQAWEDLDEDGVYEPDTDPVIAHSLAAGGASRLVAWIHPLSFEAVFYAEMFGGVGWQLLGVAGQDAPPVPVDWDEGLVLGDEFTM